MIDSLMSKNSYLKSPLPGAGFLHFRSETSQISILVHKGSNREAHRLRQVTGEQHRYRSIRLHKHNNSPGKRE